MKLAVLVASLLTVNTTSVSACTTSEAIHALALNMYHEARGESVDAMQLVGEVTLNRVKNKHFPNSVCGVVYQARRSSSGSILKHKCQFSWYCDGRSDTPSNKKLWKISKNLARGLVTNSIELLGTTATHYHTTSVKPHWSASYNIVGKYGNHIFYVMGDKL